MLRADLARTPKSKTKAAKAKLERAAPPRLQGRPSSSTIKRRHKLLQDKRSVILGAGLALFSRFGMHGTSIDQIASLADLSKSNLLYYFQSKEDLYVAVLRDLLSSWLMPLRDFSLAVNPREAIGNYIRRKVAFSRDSPEASRLFCLEMIQGAPLLGDELRRDLRELVDQKAEVVQGWIADGRLSPVDPRHFIFSLWATTQHYADFAVQVEALTGRTLNDPDFFEATIANIERILLEGVLPRG
jgi:TetR/AcrR family transcriptional regulator